MCLCSVSMPYSSTQQQREYQRRWIARQRAEFFAGKSCVQCGSRENLRLDHIDPSQKITHRIWSWTPKKRAVELAKCQLLCYPCHKSKTAQQLSKPNFHGTYYWYIKRACRCAACRTGYVIRCRLMRRGYAGKKSSLNPSVKGSEILENQ